MARAMDDPRYRAGLADLLGLLAYGELQGFARLAADAAMAENLADQAAMSAIAVNELRQFERLRDRINELGEDPEALMEPFVDSIDGFHGSTAPSDWLEGLVKLYVGDGIAEDFYVEMADFVDDDTAILIRSVFKDRGQADFVVTAVREAIADDPRIAGKLALWGRRLVGEALSQAQRVAAERDSLTELLVAGDGGLDLAGVAELFARLTTNHTERMARLGLQA